MRVNKIRGIHIVYACALVALCLGAYMITFSEPAEAAGKPCHKRIDPGVPGALVICLECCEGEFGGAMGTCTGRFPDGASDSRWVSCVARAEGKRDKCELNCLSTFP